MLKQIKNLSFLPEAEFHTIIHSFNDTSLDYPRDKCVHQLFEEQVEKTPDKTAVVACDNTLTYKNLNELSNRIANALIKKGVKCGDIIAFALPRESTLIAVMFGILKSGAAYMPVDPDYPKDRISYMLSDSGAKFYITQENLTEYISENSSNPNIDVSSENYCYCIYTSGSTGKPKGTLLTHRNVSNYVDNNNNNVLHKIIKNDYKRIVSVTTVGFDIFVTESLLPLTNGLGVLFANEEQAKIQSRLNELILKHSADVIQTTPTKMKSLIADTSCLEYLKKLKAIVLGGEALEQSLAQRLMELTDAKLFNIYGPTETTVWSTNAEITDANDITIGKPIANTQIYILDKLGKPTPIGVTGELCIAGDGVGAGYLNRPELTEEKFVDNPFGKGKMYRTGDLAYWREDGNIVYVGRNDFQVKIRGLRIELGEIENAISSVHGVSQSVVVVRKDDNGRQLICAFYTQNGDVSISEIKREISAKLPRYMMPHVFTFLAEMPLTSSGKINRKALPEVDLNNISNTIEYVKPQTKLQFSLAQIMEKVLGYSPIGLEDDFFDLGCDSLKAIEFVSKAHSDGIYFNLQNVFDYPTTRRLCECISNGDKLLSAYDKKDFEKYIPLLENNRVDKIETLPKKDIGNVFVTGATGFLGCHIIDSLIKNGAKKVYCLVRENGNRLFETLDYYFDGVYNNDSRIVPVVSDLEHLGDVELDDPIDFVVHTAASVKHYGSYKYFYDINVGGTKNAIELAKKYGAKLIHISTLSVSGNAMLEMSETVRSDEELFFDETALFIGQPLENVYARSKFEAERAVLDEMCDGLKANIIRVGNLTNRRSDLRFQKNHESNAFLQRVKAVLDLGVFPEYLMPLYSEFSPVDDTADGIVKIMERFNNRHTVFNLNHNKGLYFDKFLEYFNKLNISIDVVDGETFIQRIKLPGSESMYEALINDMDEKGNLVYDSNIRILNDFTVEYMKKLDFEWADIDFEYIKGYIEYFRKIGFLR